MNDDTSANAPPRGLLAAAPGDRRIQAAGAIMLAMLAAVWTRKTTR